MYAVSQLPVHRQDFDLCHPDLIKHAVDRAGKGEEDFTLPDAIPVVFTHFSGSKAGWPVLNLEQREKLPWMP